MQEIIELLENIRSVIQKDQLWMFLSAQSERKRPHRTLCL